MAKKSKQQWEIEYHGELATWACVLCHILEQEQQSRTSIHHPRFPCGASQRSEHALGIPLCINGCHEGPNGIGGDRSLLRIAKVTEADLLALVIKRIWTGGY